MDKKQRVSITMDTELLEKLNIQARRYGLNRSQFVSFLFSNFLIEEMKKQN